MLTSRSVRTSLALASLALLSACGSIHPGAAAVVGDERITRSELADVVSGQCKALNPPAGQVVGNSQLLTEALGVMVDSELSRQYAEAEGLDFDRKVLNAQLAQLDQRVPQSEETAAFRDTYRDNVVAQLQLADAGMKKLEADGAEKPSVDRAVATGSKLRDAWVKKNGVSVTIDPRYRPDGESGAGDGSISRAVSPFATGAAAGKPAIVRAFASGQRCGSAE